ncbi:MAG: WD40 repeat domain-containing protein [Chloroflexota bacterium]
MTPAIPLFPDPGATTGAALPSLQQLGVDNAGAIRLLRSMNIPDYSKGQLSQCSPAFSPDGRLLVGACGKNRAPVWEVQTGALVYTLYDAPVQVAACAFSPDGKYIACGGFDKAVTLWDAATGGKIGRLDGHTAPVWDLAFHPDGKSLASCSLGLLGGGAGRGDVRLWSPLDAQPIWLYSGTRDYLSLSFHPSGKVIAYGSIGGSLGILDAETGVLLTELTDSRHNIGGIAYSPGGLWLAAGSDDWRIHLWSTSNYRQEAMFEGHKGYVNGVAFSPDETLLVSGSHDRTVGVWDVAGRKLITQLTGHEGEVLRVAFSPDGTLIASISWDGTVRLWGAVKK